MRVVNFMFAINTENLKEAEYFEIQIRRSDTKFILYFI